eukprot:COSAG01_NODE_636_length_14635_cov_18.612617_9_plen_134_part_00
MTAKNSAPRIGHEPIDNQHDELYDLITKLDLALETHSIALIEDLICFLEHYVQDHFHEEETLMQVQNYEGYAYHKDEHEIFVTKVSILRKRFDRQEPITHLVFSIREIIDDLIEHIQIIDTQIPIIKEDSSNG